MAKLNLSLNELVKIDQMAFKRDQRIAQVMLESQYHQSGALNVKPETNQALKKIMNEMNLKGFAKPEFSYLVYDDDRLDQFDESIDPRDIAMKVKKYEVQEYSERSHPSKSKS